jgi:hypothetical protein
MRGATFFFLSCRPVTEVGVARSEPKVQVTDLAGSQAFVELAPEKNSADIRNRDSTHRQASTVQTTAVLR